MNCGGQTLNGRLRHDRARFAVLHFKMLVPVSPTILSAKEVLDATECVVPVQHLQKRKLPVESCAMNVQSSPPSGARHRRLSLKRGLARQVVTAAAKAQADHEVIFAQIRRMAPNQRAMERTVLRLRRASGVICAGIAKGSVVVVLRNVCTMLTRTEGVEAFTEEAVIYTRVAALPKKGKVVFWINRASFSLHTLERFIERSNCDLGAGILHVVDAEAVLLLRRVVQGGLFEQDGDEYLPANEGVWAGSLDVTRPEPSWHIVQDATIATFSARTFLGPEQMKPCVWLRWRDDPRLSLGA
jgi:hypothetical protein